MTNSTMTDGSPVTPDHREIDPATGMQKGYVVLSDEDRANGFVRALRNSYVHSKCGVETRLHFRIAETFARDPKYYSGTYCAGCKSHFNLDQFNWSGTTEIVGS